MIELYYEMSDDLIDRCEKNPAEKLSLKLMLEAVIPVIYICSKNVQALIDSESR